MRTTLTKAEIGELIAAGAVEAIYSVSTNPAYAGDVVMIDFLDASGVQVAWLTQISEKPFFLRRRYGDHIRAVRKHPGTFTKLVAEFDSLSDTALYRII